MVYLPEYHRNSPCVGEYTIKRYYWSCPKCGGYLYDLRMWDLDEKMFQERAQELLPKICPPETNEYITAEQIDELELQNPWGRKCPWRRGDIFIFHYMKDGKTLYLKESYDLYRQRGDGRFSLLTGDRSPIKTTLFD